MKRNRRLVTAILVMIVASLVGCIGIKSVSMLYDPLLKYERAGFPVRRTNIDNPRSLQWPSTMSNNLYYLELTYNTNVAGRVFVFPRDRGLITSITVRDRGNNLISRLSHLAALDYTLLSNRVYFSDINNNLMILHIESGGVSTNAIPLTHPPYDHRLESLSSRGRYVVVRRRVVLPNPDGDGFRGIDDTGLIIFDTLKRRAIPLYTTYRVIDRYYDITGRSVRYIVSYIEERHGAITDDLRGVIVYLRCPYGGGLGLPPTISGRNSAELLGWWYIDISSLGLTE